MTIIDFFLIIYENNPSYSAIFTIDKKSKLIYN